MSRCVWGVEEAGLPPGETHPCRGECVREVQEARVGAPARP